MEKQNKPLSEESSRDDYGEETILTDDVKQAVNEALREIGYTRNPTYLDIKKIFKDKFGFEL